jgi:hypothetical protein
VLQQVHIQLSLVQVAQVLVQQIAELVLLARFHLLLVLNLLVVVVVVHIRQAVRMVVLVVVVVVVHLRLVEQHLQVVRVLVVATVVEL